MTTNTRDPKKCAECLRIFQEVTRETGQENYAEAARRANMPRKTFTRYVKDAANIDLSELHAEEKLSGLGYDTGAGEKTPEQAWREHAGTFERLYSESLSKRWRTIQRPKGPYCVFHTTDEHIDDDKTPLRLIESDIRAANEMDAIKCHGGDVLNNWPLAGRLAKQWSEQQCTLPDALKRMQYFFQLLQPHVATMGNHEEMNPYLSELIKAELPKGCITDYWSVNFRVETPEGRTLRAVLSHKFQKGSSWFHKAHGHIREMLEGEECDLLMDGHLHSDGVLDHTLPERGHAALCVASAGYKVFDKYAARISKGGKTPKLRGRAHWIIVDPQADYAGNFCTAFKDPAQAEAYLSGLQNLRAA